MLTLLLGDFGSGKTSYLYREIANVVSKDAPAPSFLIVPEQATVTTEAALASLLPPSAPLSFEVTNFSRLANTVFRRTGGLSQSGVTKDSKLLLMWRALRECAPHLSSPPNLSDNGKIARLVDAVDELRLKGVSTRDLLRVSNELNEDGALQRKLADFLLVNQCYRSYFENGMTDTADDLSRMAEILEHASPFKGTLFYFDGFVSFTAQELSVLRLLLKTCPVTVTLSIPAVRSTPLAYKEVEDTVRRLVALANEGHTPFDVRTFDERLRPTPPVFHEIAKELFSSSEKTPLTQDVPASPPITVAELPDVFTEADYIASEISRLVREGMRYRDILLLGRNPDAYRGILDAALDKQGIPYYFSEKNDITEYEAIKLILSVYRMRNRGYKTEDVITYVKCGFSGLDRKTVDEFESYAATWRLHGRSFTGTKPWSLHPRGYTDRPLRETEVAMLANLNKAKETLFAPLSLLGEKPSSRTVTSHSEALVSFLEALSVEEQLSCRAAQAEAEGRRSTATDYRMLYPAICDLLDRLVSLLGTVSVTEEEFSSLLQLSLSTVKIGQIPTSVDEVVIGDASMLRPTAPRCTVLFGVNDGIFPGAPSGRSFFSEGERRTLAGHGIVLESERLIAPARERYAFIRAFLSPKEQLIMTVPHADRGLSPLYTAPVVEEIRCRGGQAIKSLSADALTPADFLWTRRGALDVLGDLRDTPDFPLLKSLVEEDESLKEKTERLTRPVVDPSCHVTSAPSAHGALPLTQSRIESFVKCPFAYTCTYLLGLREDAVASFRASETGSYVHALLENFFLILKEEEKAIGELTPDECVAFAKRASDKCRETLFPDESARTARVLHLCNRLTASSLPVLDSLVKEFRDGDFAPLFFELPISRESKKKDDAFRLEDGTPVSLYGRADRIDVCEIDGKQYLRVVDYKTGTKTFKMDNIQKGLDVQLLLYLSILCDPKETALRRRLHLHDEVYPAGVLYLLTGLPPLSTRPALDADLRLLAGEKLGRNGVLLNDKDVLSAMEKEDNGVFKMKKKDGEIASVSGFTLLDREEMQRVFDDLRQTVLNVGNAIHKGEASATPLNHGNERGDTCTYCAFKPVCRNTVPTQSDAEQE